MKPGSVILTFIFLFISSFGFSQEKVRPERGFIVIDNESSRKVTEDFVYEIELFPGEEFSGYIYHYTEEGDVAYGDLQEDPEVSWLTVSPSSFTANGCDRPVPVKFTFRAPQQPGKYTTKVIDNNWNWQDNAIKLIVTTMPDSIMADSMIIIDGKGGTYYRYQEHEYTGLKVNQTWYDDGYCGTNPYLVSLTRLITRAVNPVWPGINFSPETFTLRLNEIMTVTKTFNVDENTPDSLYEAIYSQWRSYPAYIKWKFVRAHDYCLGWEPIPSLNEPSMASGAAVCRDSVYLISGFDPFAQQPTGRVEVLRGVRWGVHPASLNVPRYSFACGALENRLYVFGGMNGNNQPLNTVEYFDGSRWITDTDTMPAPLACFSGAAYSNNYYIFGGKKNNAGGYENSLWRYSAMKGWDILHAALPFDPGEKYGCVIAGKMIYIFGGEKNGKALSDAFLYDIVADTFAGLNPMNTPRAGFACGLAGNFIYAAGGTSTDGDISTSVEFYDLTSGMWFACEDTPDLSVESAASVSLNGHLFLFGGDISLSGSEPDYRSCWGSDILAGIPPEPEPSLVALAFPNPFRDQAVINIDLPYESHIHLALYDLRGRLVIRLADEHLPAGNYNYFINGNMLAEGIYFGELRTDKERITKKLVKMLD